MPSPVMRAIMSIMKKNTTAPTYATWDPANKGANVTLSGGNLSGSTVVGGGLVRSTIGKSSGKWYWEATVPTSTSILGCAYSTATLGSYLSAITDGWGYYASNGNVYNSGGVIGSGATYTTTDVMGYALDAGAGTLALYKNNTLQYTITGLTGTIYAAAGGDGSGASSWTFNFGATAFTYSPPGGYNAGLY